LLKWHGPGIQNRFPALYFRALKEILWPFEARIFEFWRGFGDEHVRSDLRRSRNEARTKKDRSLLNTSNDHRNFFNCSKPSPKRSAGRNLPRQNFCEGTFLNHASVG
jgi:hypothetical protein